jgi:hypothetical protein
LFLPENVMHIFTDGPLMISLLLGSALVPAWGAEAPKAQQISGVSDADLSMQQQHQLSNMAVKALHLIAAARVSIARRDSTTAHQALDTASLLLDNLKTGLPSTPVSEHTGLARNRIEYQRRPRALPDLIPIYADLHTPRDFISAQQASPSDPVRTPPPTDLKRFGKEGLQVANTTLIYAEADLPITHTRQDVDAARQALDRLDWQHADNALKNAEDGVVFMSTSVDKPLSAGRQSLLQTTRLLAAGELDQARVELRRARSYLHTAAQTTDSVAKADTEQLLQDANQLDMHIQNNDADLVNDAQTLWYRTAALAERSNAYLGNEWASVMHDQPIKARLIEARLNLRDAAIDQFTAHRPAAVEAALTHTQSYLHQALKIARNSNQPQMEIHCVQKRVARLAAMPSAQRSPSQYRQLAGDLGILIGQS